MAIQLVLATTWFWFSPLSSLRVLRFSSAHFAFGSVTIFTWFYSFSALSFWLVVIYPPSWFSAFHYRLFLPVIPFRSVSSSAPFRSTPQLACRQLFLALHSHCHSLRFSPFRSVSPVRSVSFPLQLGHRHHHPLQQAWQTQQAHSAHSFSLAVITTSPFTTPACPAPAS